MFSFMLESAPPSFLCYTAYSHAHSYPHCHPPIAYVYPLPPCPFMCFVTGVLSRVRWSAPPPVMHVCGLIFLLSPVAPWVLVGWFSSWPPTACFVIVSSLLSPSVVSSVLAITCPLRCSMRCLKGVCLLSRHKLMLIGMCLICEPVTCGRSSGTKAEVLLSSLMTYDFGYAHDQGKKKAWLLYRNTRVIYKHMVVRIYAYILL